MLNRACRLRRRSDFTATVRAGRRAGRATLVIHLRHHEESTPPRAGFVVSRAVGKAVVRNRVRRRLRHLVRDHLTDLPPGTTLVVRALPPAATAPVGRLAADLAGALRSATLRAAGRSGRGTAPAAPRGVGS